MAAIVFVFHQQWTTLESQYKTRNQVRVTILSQRVTKILTLLTLWGLKWTVWPWETIFSQKLPKKQLFWRTRFWITWLWRGLAPTILKIETFSACVSENLGHELSDEPWADLLASKLSDWQPFEIFFGAAMENCRKRRFLLFFVSTPKKISNGCQSDNFDPRRSAHGSS